MESRDIALGWGHWKRGTNIAKRCVQEGETQDNTGNYGNTGSEPRICTGFERDKVHGILYYKTIGKVRT